MGSSSNVERNSKCRRNLRNFIGLLITASVIFATEVPSNAALVSSNIGVGGTFNTTLTGGGTATLNSASGTLRQWLGFFHINIGISANTQTVGLSVPTVNPGTMSAGGNVDMTYDNFTPGTPSSINSVNVDLNGNTNIPITVNVHQSLFRSQDLPMRMSFCRLVEPSPMLTLFRLEYRQLAVGIQEPSVSLATSWLPFRATSRELLPIFRLA